MITLPETLRSGNPKSYAPAAWPERKPPAKALHGFTTHSGAVLDLAGPTPADVRIEDIAMSLSRLCRANGHLDRPHTVAEHSLRVSWRLAHRGDRLAMIGLLHDAAEAYMGDCPTPLKHMLGERWRRIEDRVRWAIHEYAGIGIAGRWELDVVAAVDHSETREELESPYDDPLDCESARIQFLQEYRRLQARLRDR